MEHAEQLLPHGRNGKKSCQQRAWIGSTRGFFHQATLYVLQALASKFSQGDLTWTSRSVSVFQTSFLLKESSRTWPFFRDEATPGYSRTAVSIPAKVGNLEYAMSLQPKNSLLQRRLAEAKDWHAGFDFPGLSVVFLWVLWPEHQELLYIIELNTLLSGEVSSYLVTCQAAFWIFWMVLRTSRSWAIRDA